VLRICPHPPYKDQQKHILTVAFWISQKENFLYNLLYNIKRGVQGLMAEDQAFLYEVLGLTLKSINMEIPELTRVHKQTNDICVDVIEDDLLHTPDLPSDFTGGWHVRMEGNELWLTIKNLAYFHIDRGNIITWQRCHRGVEDQTIRNCLLGVGLGALSNQYGNLTLHGSALEKDGHAIVCMGHSGAGKSTTAYMMMMQGWKLLADDLVAISPDRDVLPSVPRIKLCKDAVEDTSVDPKQVELFKSTGKYIIGKRLLNYALQPVPLKAIYILDSRNQNNNLGTITRVESHKTMLMYLRQHVFWRYLVQSMKLEGRYFIDSIKLLKEIPMYIISLPDGISETQKWLLQQNLLKPD